MRKARFTEEQMVAIIREADRDSVSAVAKRHGISEQTIYTWRKRFGGIGANDVRRLKQLVEAENARLKKLVAERRSHPQRRHRQDEPPGPIAAQGFDRKAARAKACRKACAPEDSKDLAPTASAPEHLRSA